MITGNTRFLRIPLSGGTGNGRRIKVAVTATPGTLIHTGPVDSTVADEVWLDAHNSSGAAVILYIEWGSNTSPDDIIQVTIPAQAGLALVVPGGILVGAATALTVKARASVANVVTIGGYVNRIQ